ncbi:MAG: VCBS repeat-containing protein [Candidatus Erginobacter occultus]|nr:VCBS repeat-containing protein [Candidatus Erginobacter occultus]
MIKWMAAAAAVLLGLSGTVLAADFDGDGTNDIAIFRSSSGLWAIRGGQRIYFGKSGDQPVPGDYDGDGTVDIAIFRPTNGLWAVNGGDRVYFGQSGDQPIPGVMGAGGGQWTRIGTRIYYNTGNVGIGTDDPAALLEVTGDVSTAGLFKSTRDNGTGLKGICNSGINAWGVSGESLTGYAGNFHGKFYISGNTGIGVYDPGWKLVVAGAVMLQELASPPPPFQSGHAGIYAASGDLYGIDSGGNASILTPHDNETGEWIFYSKNLKTGRVVRVDMERMVRAIEELTGETFLAESWEKQEDL